jgi:hypothetical protein
MINSNASTVLQMHVRAFLANAFRTAGCGFVYVLTGQSACRLALARGVRLMLVEILFIQIRIPKLNTTAWPECSVMQCIHHENDEQQTRVSDQECSSCSCSTRGHSGKSHKVPDICQRHWTVVAVSTAMMMLA